MRFCNSSKNLTSVDNIDEEIDLDDINDEDIDDNDKNINNNKINKFTLTFDELDDEESNNNDSSGEIFKQTKEMIKTIKLRNKNKDNNKEIFNKKILDNIIIEDKKEEKNNKEININNNSNEIPKKKSKTLNKFNSKSKSSYYIGMKNRNNSLPIIISNEKEKENFNSEKTKELNKNEEKQDKNNIFDFNKKRNDIKVLPNIKINIKEQNHGRYFYERDINKKNFGQNINDRINNFRSNNIIKMKENKENSFFNSLKRSSDNSVNFKYSLSFFNKDKIDKNIFDEKQEKK